MKMMGMSLTRKISTRTTTTIQRRSGRRNDAPRRISSLRTITSCS